jgi:fluoride exporter
MCRGAVQDLSGNGRRRSKIQKIAQNIQHQDMSLDTAGVGVAAIAGLLLRVALLALFDTPGAPIHAILAPNVVGSLIMGAVVAKKVRDFRCKHSRVRARRLISFISTCFRFRQSPQHVMSPHLFLALSTGFCGSLTSFSSWQVAAVANLVGMRSNVALASLGRKNGVADYIFSWLLLLWEGAASPIAAFLFGRQLALSAFPEVEATANSSDSGSTTLVMPDSAAAHGSTASSIASASPAPASSPADESCWNAHVGIFVAVFSLCCAFSIWAAIALETERSASIWTQPSATIMFGIVLAPLGAWVRWFFAARFNSSPLPATDRESSVPFPAGTFLANMAGTCISGAVTIGLYSSRTSSPLACSFSAAISTGLCGMRHSLVFERSRFAYLSHLANTSTCTDEQVA